MKKKNFIIAGLSACAICALIGGTLLSVNFTSASTEQNMGFKNFKRGPLTEEQREEFEANREKRMQEMEAKHTAINEALENSDYSAWLQAVGEDCPMAEKITQDNFPKFVEAHKKIQEGQAIMEELGVGRNGFGRGKRFLRK